LNPPAYSRRGTLFFDINTDVVLDDDDADANFASCLEENDDEGGLNETVVPTRRRARTRR
jgi:hypothetical protein